MMITPYLGEMNIHLTASLALGHHIFEAIAKSRKWEVELEKDILKNSHIIIYIVDLPIIYKW